MKTATAMLTALLMIPSLVAAQIYVDADAGGMNNGSSWDDAFTDLQSALAAATSGAEVWVAAGTYKPTSGTDRTTTFMLADGVGVYGGFNGTESSLSERMISLNPTILSGEIGAAGPSDNCYHVVTAVAVSATAVLDGFTLTAGNANGGSVTFGTFGGGMLNNHAGPTLANLTFQANNATDGGGMANLASSPQLSGMNFLDNSALLGGAMYNSGGNPDVDFAFFSFNDALSGGAMYNSSASPTISGSIFASNTADDNGGAIYSTSNSSPHIDACLFEGNTADGDGGGLYNTTGQPVINASSFRYNGAQMAVLEQGRGGAISLWDCPSTCVTNCVFDNNRADLYGGAIAAFGCDLVVTNGTFYGNTLTGSPFSPDGGAIYASESSGSITNTISWGNDSNEVFCTGVPAPTHSYSLAQVAFVGGTNGGGMIVGQNPLFANPAGGDLTVEPSSPVIDAGDNNAPKITATDRDGNSRIVGGTVDIGAYEYDSATGIPPVVAGTAVGPAIRSLYPNPFNPVVTVEFDVARAGDVAIGVYDVTGRRVRTIAHGTRSAGPHTVRWDATDDLGTPVASGVYFVVVSAGPQRDQRKVTLLK